ncbi:MAG TPA: hypothetical protein VKP69_16045, partial [Isosphaeraceae bacterium]|nr:hypothetical protein [Isosphaeraceae bacterium]
MSVLSVGAVFGILGDRIGRAKTMLLTILMDSATTGLGALAANVWAVSFFRSLTGLVGGGGFAVGGSRSCAAAGRDGGPRGQEHERPPDGTGGRSSLEECRGPDAALNVGAGARRAGACGRRRRRRGS